MTRDSRRLAAIVSADVVGYSRLMGRDESGTLAVLKGHRRELIDPKIAEYGGRIVKTTGDGLLLEFPSVVDAVRCAVDVQRGMAERNATHTPDQRMDFRIGINVGDIIIDADDIFGDGVNVAARLQALADPGGICVSRAVRDQVRDKVNFGFEDLGAQEVKNIARPVEVYRLDLDRAPESLPSPSLWRRFGYWIRWGVLGLGATAVVVVATVALRSTGPRSTGAASSRPALSLAILPFAVNAPGDGDVQLAEDITQNVTSVLETTAHYAKVTSYAVASSFRGKAVDAKTLGQELNVRFIVEGRMSRVGEHVALDARLVNTFDGTQVWSDHLEAERAQIADPRSNAIRQFAGRLRGAVATTELRRAGEGLAPDASAMEVALYATAQQAKDPDLLHGALEARKLYDQALRLDPGLVFALVAKASTIGQELEWNPRADHKRLVQELEEVSWRALSLDDKDPRVWQTRARSLVLQQRWDAALEALDNSLKLDPGRVDAVVERAEIMLLTGRPSEALILAEQASASDSPDSRWVAFTMFVRCQAKMAMGQYDDAISSCQKSIAAGDWWMAHCYLVAAYAHRGDTKKATSERAVLEGLVPRFSIEDFKAARPSDDPNYVEQNETHLYAGLRKAGIRDK